MTLDRSSGAKPFETKAADGSSGWFDIPCANKVPITSVNSSKNEEKNFRIESVFRRI